MTRLHRVVYEPNKTYPCVMGHRIVELDGAKINEYYKHLPITLSYIEYKSLLERIENLETLVMQK